MEKRERQKADLYRGIERISNELRCSFDGWDFKQYMFGFMFYQYLSNRVVDNFNNEVKYIDLTDEEGLLYEYDVKEKLGYFLLPSELFDNVLKFGVNGGDISEKLILVFSNIIESTKGLRSEYSFQGLLEDVDLDSIKLGGSIKEKNESLMKLMKIIGSIDLGEFNEAVIDPFGDAYEALMGMYAKNAGRSGGEYFTPQEVSKLLSEICFYGQEDARKIYDPTCGSGSLLLQGYKKASELGIPKDDIKIYGQEKNYVTYNLSKMNMILHGIDYDNFNITQGDTLKEYKNKDDGPFDVIVSNPPYSVKWEGERNPMLIHDPRFASAGVLAPSSKADLAFVMHILHALSDTGTAAVASFPGVMYRTNQKSEQQLRRYLVKNNYVDAIIELPGELFYGTGIQISIMVLKKNKTSEKVKFINAENEFIKSVNFNQLSDENINNIMEYYTGEEVKYISKFVDNTEIAENEYNLAVSTYVEREDLSKKIDIEEVNRELGEVVEEINRMRTNIDELIAEIEGGGKLE